MYKSLKTIHIWRNTLHGLTIWERQFRLANPDGHQNLNKKKGELSFGRVFGVELGFQQTQWLIKTEEPLSSGNSYGDFIISWKQAIDDNMRRIN